MKPLCSLVIALPLLTSCAYPQAIGPAPTPTVPADSRIDRFFSQWDRTDSPGCALGIVRNGQFIYQRTYGMAEPEAKTPFDANTVFSIGSMGKQFTAMSIRLLAERG